MEGNSGAGHSGTLRLKGPPVETIKVEAELDATDKLESGDTNAVQLGLQAQLAALETIIYPTSTQLLNNNRLTQSGNLEIIPMEAPLVLFIWNKNRILPVRITGIQRNGRSL